MSEDHLGAQNTVCGGGRYDGLVAHLRLRYSGDRIAIGLERLLLILSETDQGRNHTATACLSCPGWRGRRTTCSGAGGNPA